MTLREHQDAFVRSLAANALTDVAGRGDALALSAVVARLKDRHPLVRRIAASAIGDLAMATGNEAATAAVTACLQDRDPGVRRAAMATLGRLCRASGDSTATAHLAKERTEKNEDPRVRSTARHALRELNVPAERLAGSRRARSRSRRVRYGYSRAGA